MFLSLLVSVLALVPESADTLSLDASVVTAAKQEAALGRLASPSTTVESGGSREPQRTRLHSLNNIVPGLLVPDYGASLTSTIYIRGLGSRMENPSISLYVDDIPVLDKNAYDTDWYGVSRATVIRGPQGTLYGRNSMGGVMLLQTPSAASQGLEALVEGGSAGQFRLGVGYGSERNYLSLSLRRRDGYFRNEYKGEDCDPYRGALMRWRWCKTLSDRTGLSNSLHVSLSDEGGFAYGPYVDGELLGVSYNDEGSYRRLSVMDGFSFKYMGERTKLSAAASVQLLLDRMRMDQDFTPVDIFTLSQRQRSTALTLELVARPAARYEHWQPQSGVFIFAKLNAMSAPVRFKESGIRSLILDNANRNIPEAFGKLDISEREFPVESDFGLYSWGAAVYHESVWSFGRWLLTAGLRLDYEGGYMDYDSQSTVHYLLSSTMSAYRPYTCSYKGSESLGSVQLLPKLSALYAMPLRQDRDMLSPYACVSKGYRAGGFNTQIFSDILQLRMMNGITSDLGVYLDSSGASVGAADTRYKPEEAWNFELGLRYRRATSLSAEINAYHIICRNQQMTVFPPGKSTGRMMTNAGRSLSSGVEAQIDWRAGDWRAQLSGSWCDARFDKYHDGNSDYSHKHIPYAPQGTFYAALTYDFAVGGRPLSLSVDAAGTGPVWWDEANTLSSALSVSEGATLSARFDRFELYLRADNLSGEQSRVFYFKSVGNEFFALSKPRRAVAGLIIKL